MHVSAKQELEYITQGYGSLTLDIQDPVAVGGGGDFRYGIAFNFRITSGIDWIAQQLLTDSIKFRQGNFNIKSTVNALWIIIKDNCVF